MVLKHVLLKNPRLHGWEYGVLRALEDEIVQQTGATVVEVPDYGLHSITGKAGHGMRWDGARRLLPKKSLPVQADVIWYILMGPENYELDLFKDWDRATHRIVYIYDTLEPQFNLIQKLFSDNRFNIRITSFHDAVPYLEELTRKKWHPIEQAVPASLFTPVTPDKKIIHFSSYGRKLPRFHDVLLQFCKSNGLYYDYSTHDAKHQPNAPEAELYQLYAWHVSHSAFTVSWPVELTNPKRAGRLHPITCRWFEAAACGTAVIGQSPDNILFDKLLHPDLVIKIDPDGKNQDIFHELDKLWKTKDLHQQTAYTISKEMGEKLTWKNRVTRMIDLL